MGGEGEGGKGTFCLHLLLLLNGSVDREDDWRRDEETEQTGEEENKALLLRISLPRCITHTLLFNPDIVDYYFFFTLLFSA